LLGQKGKWITSLMENLY